MWVWVLWSTMCIYLRVLVVVTQETFLLECRFAIYSWMKNSSEIVNTNHHLSPIKKIRNCCVGSARPLHATQLTSEWSR